jgi:hypothetical protein
LLPGLEIRQKHPLQTIAKRPTDAEHCRKVVAPRTGHELALVGRRGDLVKVATDAPSAQATVSEIASARKREWPTACPVRPHAAAKESGHARAAFLDTRSAISAVNTLSNRDTQIVIRPLKSAEFGSRERPE